MRASFLGSLIWVVSLALLEAELTWESREVGFQIEKPSFLIPVFFTCENTGLNPISVTSVVSTCQCLEVQAGDGPIAPSESRTILVVFRPGIRVGPQKIDFKLRTSEEKVYQLSLKGTVPKTLILDPPVLVWNVQESLEAQTFTVKIADGIPAKISEIYSMDENFLTSTQEAAGSLQVKVSPQQGKVRRLARVAIVTENEDQEKRSFFLLMRIADRDPNKAMGPKLKNALYRPEELETPARTYLKEQEGSLARRDERLLKDAAGSLSEKLPTRNSPKISE